MSFHSGQTFVYGETPSASKWQYIWDNDAALADGTAITALSLSTTSISNPYKFSAYRNSAANTGNGAFAKLTCDVEVFDTNNNFASGTYTAPVAGFYQFSSFIAVAVGAGSVDVSLEIYKNGSSYKRFAEVASATTNNIGVGGSILAQSAAGDTWDIYTYASSAKALQISSTYNYFMGFLVSRT